jgi:hypothetical protein
VTLLSLLFACTRDEPVDTGDGPPEGLVAVVATVADDYAAGALVLLDGDSPGEPWPMVATSGDPQVVVVDGRLALLERDAASSLRIYEPGAWSEPAVEVRTGANPQDVEACGPWLFASSYDATALEVRDPVSGALAGEVDLSSLADADGLPELASLVCRGDLLYVSAHRFDRDDAWAAGAGAVAEVDCTALEVTRTWEVGPSPDLFPHPTREGALVVRTGAWGTLDGGLAVLDPETGLEPLLSEVDLGEEIVGFGASGEVALVLSADSAGDFSYGVQCLDLAGGILGEAARTPSALWGISVSPAGKAWISARTSWADPDSAGGTWIWDVADCTPMGDGNLLETPLQPYSIAFVEVPG